MSEPNQRRPSAVELQAQGAVRALPAVHADAAFRARLEQAFTTGAFPAPARPIVPLPWYRRPVAWIAVPAVVAAALAFALVLNQGPRWGLAGAAGAGNAIVDGRPIPMNHEGDLRRAVRGGARVVVPRDGELQLANGDNMMILATAGTEFVIPAAPGRWFGRRVAASMRHGTLRVSTRPGFAGARLEVTTPEAAVEVTGSTLAIICEDAGTCVCVLDGGVAMGPLGGASEEVPGGMRRFVFRDGRAPEMAEMRPSERTELTDFREQASRVSRATPAKAERSGDASRLAAAESAATTGAGPPRSTRAPARAMR
jgi:ferric-dicitrate binding protein FerR (iron transport regulator)